MIKKKIYLFIYYQPSITDKIVLDIYYLRYF